jgi:CHASE1-domain containing sensor protein
MNSPRWTQYGIPRRGGRQGVGGIRELNGMESGLRQNAILGMSWIPRVTREQRAAYEHAATRDGIPAFRIKAVAADGSMAPSPEKDEYFPVFYTATESPGSRVYGLDLNDGGVRQKTLECARDYDSLATSPTFTQ